MSAQRVRRDTGPRPPSLGLDVGSVNLHVALLSRNGEVTLSFSLPLKGRPQAALAEALERVLPVTQHEPITLGLTGTGRDLLSLVRGVCFENEIVACSLAARTLLPKVKCLLELGGHFSKWMLLDENGDILDYSINEPCAAGSGAFLEQQASRLAVTPAELAALAAKAPSAATVAGRCSVFAKSDMVHLQQKGTPRGEIAFGVCLALARNCAATVLKGREVVRPVAMIGGAAANIGLFRAFKEVLHLEDHDLLVPEGHDVFGAVGAAMSAASQRGTPFSVEVLLRRVSEALAETDGLPPLACLPTLRDNAPRTERRPATTRREGEAYLGVDVGSVSTDFALIDRNCEVLGAVYLPTRRQPIAAMEEGIAELQKSAHSRTKILAAVTTGSGRHLAKHFLRADAARNEITTQLRSASHYFPGVDTIFEIGGQDSKSSPLG